jgi:deoxyuridine 5'-triphosphate nucleotidohydrolase
MDENMVLHMKENMRVEFEKNQLCITLKVDTLEKAENYAMKSNQDCEISEIIDEIYNNNGFNFIVKWVSTEAIDLLSNIHEPVSTQYLQPLIASNLVVNYRKTREDAVAPYRVHGSDSGYDMTLIDVVKTVGDVTFYTTHIQVEPPHGYYFDLVARSSLSKTGYMLANAVGIIDQNYRGDVIVPLRKVNKDAEDMVLPCRCVQLIPRQWYHMELKENTTIANSQRGEGGFGSTN